MEIKNYVIEFEDFKGPANVLLDLVRKRKVDIYRISLSNIIQDFIDYIQNSSEVALDTITGFIYIASILLEIKSSSVIPSQQKNVQEDEIDEISCSRFLEEMEKNYRIFLKISNYIRHLKEKEELYYLREAGIEKQLMDVLPDLLEDLDLENLNYIASKLLGRKEFTIDLSKVYIEDATITIIDAMEKIKSLIAVKKEVTFKDITGGYKLLVDKIICFLSMLELYKNEIIDILQFENFGDIIIKKIN
ncbi:MAG: segregation/condensation protein A [Actinobacteria bacterium]|nr:segregation/condensation protein A [Actinomycetota bacterium]